MKQPTTKTILNVLISLVTGLVFGLAYHNFQEARNEDPENGVQALALTSNPEYAKENAFFSSFYTQPPAYTDDYSPKDRCRVEYLFQGGADNSRGQSIVVTIDNQSGTPGGDTAKGEGTHSDFYIYRFKVISNREVSVEEMQKLATPPQGWLIGKWHTSALHQPVARKTFENCLVADSVETPKR